MPCYAAGANKMIEWLNYWVFEPIQMTLKYGDWQDIMAMLLWPMILFLFSMLIASILGFSIPIGKKDVKRLN